MRYVLVVCEVISSSVNQDVFNTLEVCSGQLLYSLGDGGTPNGSSDREETFHINVLSIGITEILFLYLCEAGSGLLFWVPRSVVS